MQTLEIRKYVFGRFVVIFVIQVCHVGFALSFYWHVLSFCCHVVVMLLSFICHLFVIYLSFICHLFVILGMENAKKYT
jgi:hypothetical protein